MFILVSCLFAREILLINRSHRSSVRTLCLYHKETGAAPVENMIIYCFSIFISFIFDFYYLKTHFATT